MFFRVNSFSQFLKINFLNLSRFAKTFLNSFEIVEICSSIPLPHHTFQPRRLSSSWSTFHKTSFYLPRSVNLFSFCPASYYPKEKLFIHMAGGGGKREKYQTKAEKETISKSHSLRPFLLTGGSKFFLAVFKWNDGSRNVFLLLM